MDLEALEQQRELLELLKTHDTPWTPSTAQGRPKVTLHIALDGCIVPTEAGGARVDYSHLIVLDNFIDETTRQQLIDHLTAPGWTANNSNSGPPESKWEKATCDAAEAASKPRARTWGLNNSFLQQFAAGSIPAKLEVQSRLCRLYPDKVIAHMPSEHIQSAVQAGLNDTQQYAAQEGGSAHQQHKVLMAASGHQQREAQDRWQPHEGQQEAATTQVGCSQQQEQEHNQQLQTEGHAAEASGSPLRNESHAVTAVTVVPANGMPAVQADCSYFLANAAVHGDNFSWHVDADPSTFPTPSPWTRVYGNYCNREAGKPLLFSLLLYLDKEWPLDCDAETLFLDSITDTGIFVRPKAYRAVLMDQDVMHRLSAPSPAAGRPRYSLVWKLAMLPKQPGSVCSLARPEWGAPTYFGSAAQVRQAAIAAAATATGMNGVVAETAANMASRKRAAEELNRS